MKLKHKLLFIIIFLYLNVYSQVDKNFTDQSNDSLQQILNSILDREWHVYSNSSFGVMALDDSGTASFMNRAIILKQDIAIILSDTCYSPIYSISKVDVEDYFALIRCRPPMKKLGFKSNNVYLITINCKGAIKYFNHDSLLFSSGVEILFSNDNRLSIDHYGVLFHLRENKKKQNSGLLKKISH